MEKSDPTPRKGDLDGTTPGLNRRFAFAPTEHQDTADR